jgi:hypothetical protein
MAMSKCILWPGGTQSKGYGVVMLDGKPHLAHRVAYKMANPSVEIGGMTIMHSCDVRICVNAAHLSVGTPQQNTDDMMAKGRWRKPLSPKRGPCNGRRKLTWDLVEKIRKEYKPGQYGYGCERLGAKYGVSDTAIFQVVKGRTWKKESTK